MVVIEISGVKTIGEQLQVHGPQNDPNDCNYSYVNYNSNSSSSSDNEFSIGN
jgi:hypothetical protein